MGSGKNPGGGGKKSGKQKKVMTKKRYKNPTQRQKIK
jgi:hypothetical protein